MAFPVNQLSSLKAPANQRANLKNQFGIPSDVYCLNKYMHVFRLELPLFGNIFFSEIEFNDFLRLWKKQNVF